MVTTEASMQCTPWRESRIELFLYYLASLACCNRLWHYGEEISADDPRVYKYQ